MASGPGFTSSWRHFSLTFLEQSLRANSSWAWTHSDCHCECWDGPAFPLTLTPRTLLCVLCEVPFPHWMSGKVSNFQKQELFVNEIIKFQSLAMGFEHVLILPESPTFFPLTRIMHFLFFLRFQLEGCGNHFLSSLFYRWKCKRRHGKHWNPVSEENSVKRRPHMGTKAKGKVTLPELGKHPCLPRISNLWRTPARPRACRDGLMTQGLAQEAWARNWAQTSQEPTLMLGGYESRTATPTKEGWHRGFREQADWQG